MQPWTEALLKRLTSGSVHAGWVYVAFYNVCTEGGLAQETSKQYIYMLYEGPSLSKKHSQKFRVFDRKLDANYFINPIFFTQILQILSL